VQPKGAIVNDTINNESNVNTDNGETHDQTGEVSSHLVGTVWSIGLAREVEVIGHSTDPTEDVWLVARDDDGDTSPDRAQRRAGSDLLPNFKIGNAVRLFVREHDDADERMTIGVVATRSHRGLYVHTAVTLRDTNAGAVFFPWEWVRERFNENRFAHATGLEAEMASRLYSSLIEVRKDKAEAEQQVANAEYALTEFKETVRRIAGRYARKHELCGVVNEALADMGLDSMIQPRFEVTVTLTKTYRINADDEEAARERVLHLVDDIETSGEDSAEDFEVWGELVKEADEGSEVSD
jgi:hypothetical protein